MITVCVTTYNQTNYIRRCLESVLDQKVAADLEILVGDDCSDDGTSDIISAIAAEYPGRLMHLRHSPRIGASTNTQQLLQRASGHYIAKLDGDDYWLPGKLQGQLQFLADHPECVAVYTNALTVDKDDRPIGIFNDFGDRTFDLSELLRGGNFLNNSSMMLRAELKQPWLALTGPLLDYRVHLLHAQQGFLGHIGQPFVVYRVASSGSMVVNDATNVRSLYWEAVQSVPRHLISERVLAQGMANFYCRVISRAVRTRNLKLVKVWWPEIRRASPYGALRITTVIFRECLRIVGTRLLALFKWGTGGRRPRVMYRR
jgi:glycosyltransferase involved in cell wall biosynthesis